jgi:prophage maintenance system killer protein
VDGNKRTALGATDTFLRLNSHFIDCDNRETYDHFMKLFETNSFRFAELLSWLRDKVKNLPVVG